MAVAEPTVVRPELEDFLRGIRPQLRRLLKQRHIPAPDAEDLLQQTLMAMWVHWPSIRRPERWAFGALRRTCAMYWRSRRRRRVRPVDDDLLEWLAEPVPPSQERDDLLRDLDKAMLRLPEHYRSLLRLRFTLGYEPPEVARRLGYRPSSIGKVTSRCLEALNDQLVAGMPRLRRRPWTGDSW